MRARRSSVNGGASGSAAAAAWTSSSVSASKRRQSWLPVFLVVRSSLIGLGLAGCNDANSSMAHRVANEQQTALDHADDAVALFVRIPFLILPFYRKRVAKYVARHLECDGMD